MALPSQPQPVRVLWSPVIGDLYAKRPITADGEWATLCAHMMEQCGDIPFNVAEPVTLLASAANQRVCDFTPGPNRLAWVRGVAMGVANLADFDNIVWRIFVDDQAMPGFDSIRGPFGVFIYPRPILIPVRPDQTVKVTASNLTAVAIPLVTAHLMGHHFPPDVQEPTP